MPATGTAPITPQGIRDGDPQVLAALASRRGPAVVAFAGAVCEPHLVVRAGADALARFRALVADPRTDTNVHPDALLLRCARRAALDLVRPGPDLGCGPAAELLGARGEGGLDARDTSLLERHLESCQHCRDLAAALESGDRAYRQADDTPLDSSALAPMVAALAAAAPIAPAPEPPNVRILPTEREETDVQPEAEPEAAPEPEAEIVDAEPIADEPEPEPDPEPVPEPEPEVIDAEPVAEEREPEPEPEPEVIDYDPEIPIGTKRLTGAPAAYYEVPPPVPRRRSRRAKAAARGAAAAGGVAASLTRRAGEAARKRMDRPPEATPPPPPEPAHEPEPEPEPETRSWAVVESIEFPAAPPVEEEYDPTVQRDELDETAARAAARHYRRLRHRRQREEVVLPSDGSPPRLQRPLRDRGPHLPLSAHGPRDLALPAGLVVLAVLVIMAVSGVFGGGSETPATGTSAESPPEVSMVSQSATSISLEDAERIAGRAGTTP